MIVRTTYLKVLSVGGLKAKVAVKLVKDGSYISTISTLRGIFIIQISKNQTNVLPWMQ